MKPPIASARSAWWPASTPDAKRMGGVSSMQDLRSLEYRGIAGVVIGMALYTGTLDPVVVAGEFGQ